MAVLDAETLAPATTPPPARLSKISQEDFDAMVQESIDTFDMEPEEAVESALEECAMQKRDVSAICKKADGVNVREALPIVVAFRKLDAQLPKGVPLPGTTAGCLPPTPAHTQPALREAPSSNLVFAG